MIGFCPLASGSKGNCLYLGFGQTKLLIDAGLSAKATKAKLHQIGVDIADIDAILITHEHSDHIQGLPMLAAKMGIPVFCNHDTATAACEILGISAKFKLFTTGETFEYQDLQIHPFSVHHDALDPVAFTIHTARHKVGICTDLGFASTLVETKLKNCDYLLLEANHQPSMVHACHRPPIYKQRVLGRTGHLSNEECGHLISKIYTPALQRVYLAHLSSECNTPQTAVTVINQILEKKAQAVPLFIASQKEVSEPALF